MIPSKTSWRFSLFQLSLLVAVTGWAMLDARFAWAVDSAQLRLADLWSVSTEGSRDFRLTADPRIWVLGAISTVLFISWSVRLIQLFHGGARQRGISALFQLVTAIALWIGLVTQYPSLCWQGKSLRASHWLDQLENIRQPLADDWPTDDGDSRTVGPFMAYPFGKPSTLILLTPPQVAGQEIAIISVERLDSGALLFQLGDVDEDDWLEWHPANSAPTSFTAGLGEAHTLMRVAGLGRGWYLTRYGTSSDHSFEIASN